MLDEFKEGDRVFVEGVYTGTLYTGEDCNVLLDDGFSILVGKKNIKKLEEPKKDRLHDGFVCGVDVEQGIKAMMEKKNEPRI